MKLLTENGHEVLIDDVDYKGVYASGTKWAACIRYNRRNKHIGVFNSKEHAAKAYNEKALELFGEFASLNSVAGVS